MTKLLYEDLTSKQLTFFLKYIWNDVGSCEVSIKPPHLIFSNPSKFHDFYYYIGGTQEDKKWADKDFLHKAHDEVRKQLTYKRPFYYFMAYVYYYGLKKLGKISFEYYPAPASNWAEFIDHVKSFYIREQQYIPSWLIGAEYIN